MSTNVNLPPKDIVFAALEVFQNNPEKLQEWYITPCEALNNRPPCEAEQEDVIILLQRMEYGLRA